MKTIKFTKMQGTNNDFIIINGINQDFENITKLTQQICHRKSGVGADQLIILKNSSKANFRMDNYNPNGNKVEICGNALRALALYLYHNNFIRSRLLLTIETLAGVKKAQINKDKTVTINMGQPSFDIKDIGLAHSKINNLKILDKIFSIDCVAIGNPHCVITLENNQDLDKFPLEIYGPLIENHSLFKNKINVEFIQKISENHIQMRVWERDVGITESCGSGACASTVIFLNNELNNTNQVKVSLPGGDLLIEWKNHQDILMTGPAKEVFTGEFSFV